MPVSPHVALTHAFAAEAANGLTLKAVVFQSLVRSLSYQLPSDKKSRCRLDKSQDWRLAAEIGESYPEADILDFLRELNEYTLFTSQVSLFAIFDDCLFWQARE